MAYPPTSENERPMADLNTTPLIDVMLVLLVMFIITVPVASHSVDIDLPQPCGAECDPAVKPNAIKNKIVLDDGNRIFWNGTVVTHPQMIALLVETTEMSIEPELQFEPAANASYDLAAKTLNAIKSTGVTKFGFVGNERYGQFASHADNSAS